MKGEFLDRIAGIVFLATPHTGSILANIASAAHWFMFTTMNDLTASNASLLYLRHTYGDRIANREAKIRHRVYYEGEGVWGAEVVKPSRIVCFSAIVRDSLRACKFVQEMRKATFGVLALARRFISA